MCWMPKEIAFACFLFLQFLISRNKSSLRGPCFASKLADLEFIEMMKRKNLRRRSSSRSVVVVVMQKAKNFEVVLLVYRKMSRFISRRSRIVASRDPREERLKNLWDHFFALFVVVFEWNIFFRASFFGFCCVFKVTCYFCTKFISCVDSSCLCSETETKY